MENDAPLRRSRRRILLAAGGAGLFSVGGLIGAGFVKSPQQRRAETEAPPRTLLTARVERRVLAATVVTRGQVIAGHQVEATPTAVQGASVMVVSAWHTTIGAQVEAGVVVLTVSGRPLVALPGALPPYRDMRPGDEGSDISQLQTALRSLGLYSGGDTSGRFGSATKAAVKRLYGRIGYSVPDTGGPGGKGDRAALRAAADAVEAARQRVNSLESRIASNPGATPQPGEPSLQQQLETARRQLNRSIADHEELIASTGTMMPLSEVVFLPSFPATVVGIGAKVGQVVEAPLITFATGALDVRVRLQPDQAELLRAGMPVELTAEALGKQAAATVASVGEVTAETEQGQPGPRYVPVTVVPNDALPSQWNGLDVRVTVTAAQSAGEVLVVPLSAVSAAADGRTTVVVVDGDDRRVVRIRPGVSGDGYIEVSAVDGELRPGDVVVIGQ